MYIPLISRLELIMDSNVLTFVVFSLQSDILITFPSISLFSRAVDEAEVISLQHAKQPSLLQSAIQ